MKTSILKKISAAVICFALLAGLSSCSKKKDDTVTPPNSKGKTAKFTVSVTGAPSSAYISFVMAGVATDVSNSTVWKINNVTQNNEMAVSLGQNNFAGNVQTYVVESVIPLQSISVGVQCLSPANVPYTISYKAEINGEVKANDQNVSVTKDADFTHDYTY
jgi:Ni,Fe-hydrogenase III small subunit